VPEAKEGFTGYNTRILLANRSNLSCELAKCGGLCVCTDVAERV